MAKVKVVNNKLNENLNGGNFNDTPSNTLFSFGSFFVTTNFDNKVTTNYTNTLSSFVTPVTLESMQISEKQSTIINDYSTNAVLNLDKSDLNTFVRFGSAYEFIRTSVQNIILAYPGSLFANSKKVAGGNLTYIGYSYDNISNVSTFYIPTAYTTNKFGLVYNAGNESIPDDNELKNLNNSFLDYDIWSSLEPNRLFHVIGYTGNTINSSLYYDSGGTYSQKELIRVQVQGNPFELMGTGTTGSLDYHLRPNNIKFEEFRALLNNYEKHIVSERDGTDGFIFRLKDPTLLEDGKITYNDIEALWNTSDGYNVDIDTPRYQRFLEVILVIGAKYDKIKTDLIARFLTPESLKTYDLTEEGKISKLLRVYGREFDQIRQFIDSLVNINKVTYDKINNVPDQIIRNMAKTFGWDYFSLVNESELVESFLTVDDTERNLNDNLLPAEIDIELWRRIINNTGYFWKSKGTRQAIKSMFMMIGIPEPFINITEYVYTVDGKINPNTQPIAEIDFPSNSLPYDTEGYPVAPLETNDFYFQMSGDTDSGQAYLDVFRTAGFNLMQTPDNKKSWIQTGSTTRVHYSTPQYYQGDSKLVINTKEVDVSLDTARGIEYDVYEYIQRDFTANSSGYTMPYSYVNISNLAQAGNTFELPVSGDYHKLGDLEVRYNGILLNAPSIDDAPNNTRADYEINGNSFTIYGLSGGTRPTDVIQATFVNSGDTALSGVTVKYVVTRVNASLTGTYLPLPSFPRGDVQVTINGIALTKGTPQFNADYILDPSNSSGGTNQIIIQNPDVVSYLNENPEVQISYVDVDGSNDINLRSEIVRVDSFNTSKIYFNNSANKYVYKLNYKINDASEVKFLVDGVALEPKLDYNINIQNPYEIFLPRGIRYGTVLSAYYLVGGNGAFEPVIDDTFGLGDISNLSFLEFLELVQRKMVNVRTRKTVTNFKGGWYPTVLRIYETYLKRANLADSNPLQSNGYTFQNLYPFLSKYNAFFQRFVNELLAATIILRRGGLLVRNSIFTKQKHWYKRGVNVPDVNNIGHDLRGIKLLQYFGDDGSKFQIPQSLPLPPPPITAITQLYVETTTGVIGSLITGGENIIGYDEITEYGIDYRLVNNTYGYGYGYGYGSSAINSTPIGLQNLLEGIDYEIEILENQWTRIVETGPLTSNSFSMVLTGLQYSSDYEYRAFVNSTYTGATGETLVITTPAQPAPSVSISTVSGSGSGYLAEGVYYGRISSTGGYNIVGYENATYYGMQYRKWNGTSWNTWTISPSPPLSITLTQNMYGVTINGLDAGSSYQYRAYMVVSGSTYYGEIKETTTTSQPQTNFTVVTDNSPLILDNTVSLGFETFNNTFTGGYPTTVVEYGMLYTTNATQGTSSNLVYTNTLISKDSVVGSTTSPFGKTLISNTTFGDKTVYYRAFVKNAAGIGYGNVESVYIAKPTVDPYDVVVIS